MRLSDDEILKFDELVNSLVEGISETAREDPEEWLVRSKARRRYIKFMDMNASLHHAEFQGAIPDDDPEGYSPDSQPARLFHRRSSSPCCYSSGYRSWISRTELLA